MALRDILLRIRALIAPRRVERELDEELAFHIEREALKHIAAGLSPAAARARALARFGSVPLAADECRDARGIRIVDEVIRDIRYALRTFRRAPLAALTIVATVGLGLGLVAVVFTLYSALLLRVDAVRNPSELFTVELQRRGASGSDDESVWFARPDYDAMRRETSIFADAVAMKDDAIGGASIDGRLARAMLVTDNYFQMLGVQAALGRPLLPGDDEPSASRPVIVLSHAGWRKLLQADPGVIGRRVTIGDAPYEIVGVMPENFRGLGITPPDYWVPLTLAEELSVGRRGRDERSLVQVIARVKPGLSREAAAAALSGWATARAEFKASTGHPIQVSLTPRQGTLPHEEFDLVFAPLFFAFGLILLIGCANVANLLLARGVSRQREIGIRLSLGASRPRIIRQLLTESLILSLVAAACGVAIARLLLDGLLYGVIGTLPPEIAQFVTLFNVATPTSDWRVMVFLGAGAVVATMGFGLAPALRATRIDLVSTMRGELIKGASPRRARHALIAVQVGASALLLICAVMFLRGAIATATKDPGIRTADTLRISDMIESRRAVTVQTLTSDPLVAKIAASSRKIGGTLSAAVPTSGPTSAGTTAPRVWAVATEAVSSDYFEILGIELVTGRTFTQTERGAEAGVVIVSSILARQIWPDGNAVGQRIRLDVPQRTSPYVGDSAVPQPRSGTFLVVGVTRGADRSSATSTADTVYLPNALETPDAAFVLRVRGNPELVRPTLMERAGTLNVMTFRTMVSLGAYLLQLAFCVAIVLGGLALVLTVSGLFSVLSYIVEQQAKEIGVRMALGAAIGDVVRFILVQSARPVAIGLAAGIGLAGAVAIVLISTSANGEIAGVVDVRDPVAYAASLVIIVVSCALAVAVPTLRAARIDPMATLRRD